MCEYTSKTLERLNKEQRLYLIEQWIFVAKYREILKLKIIDGYTYEAIAAEFDMSDRQIKNIVKSCIATLKEHI